MHRAVVFFALEGKLRSTSITECTYFKWVAIPANCRDNCESIASLH